MQQAIEQTHARLGHQRDTLAPRAMSGDGGRPASGGIPHTRNYHSQYNCHQQALFGQQRNIHHRQHGLHMERSRVMHVLITCRCLSLSRISLPRSLPFSLSVSLFYRDCMSERVLRDVTCVINAGRFENTEPARVGTISHRSGCIAHAHGSRNSTSADECTDLFCCIMCCCNCTDCADCSYAILTTWKPLTTSARVRRTFRLRSYPLTGRAPRLCHSNHLAELRAMRLCALRLWLPPGL